MRGQREKKRLCIVGTGLLLSVFVASWNPMPAYAVSDATEITEAPSEEVDRSESGKSDITGIPDASAGNINAPERNLDASGEGQSEDYGEAEPEAGVGQYELPAETGDKEEQEEPVGATEGTQASDQESVQQGNPEKEEGITGSAFVEVNPEKVFDRELVDSIGRTGGILQGDVLFSAESITYQIRLHENMPNIASLKYKLGELEGTVPVTEKTAQLEIPVGISAALQIWAGQGEAERLIFEEYLVIEAGQPEITYKRIRKEDGEQYIHVTAEDTGEILSGIKEWKCIVDGNEYIPEEIVGTEAYTIWEEKEIPVKQELDILLEGEESHEIQIAVSDNAGNTSSQTFSMKALPEDVVSVSLPTYFYIAIRPYETGENTQIYSDDVVVCNKSAFPVDVIVTSALVEINHTLPGEPVVEESEKGQKEKEGETTDLLDEVTEGKPEYQKDCQIHLKLRQFEEEPFFLSLAEGASENVISFSLAAGREETEAEELMRQRYLSGVEGGDYALLNVCGDLKEGSEDLWRGGDLVVQLVFEFHRQENIEE